MDVAALESACQGAREYAVSYATGAGETVQFVEASVAGAKERLVEVLAVVGVEATPEHLLGAAAAVGYTVSALGSALDAAEVMAAGEHKSDFALHAITLLLSMMHAGCLDAVLNAALAESFGQAS